MSVSACGFAAIGTCNVRKPSVHLGKDTDRNEVLLARDVLMAVQWGSLGFCTTQTQDYAIC